VPIVVTSAVDDEQSRVEALRGGADVFVGKPLCAVDVAAQIRAIVGMARRLRTVAERASFLPEASEQRAIIGDLQRMNVATVLSALELEQRSGDLRLRGARPNASKLVLNMATGTLVGGWLGSRPLSPLAAMRQALSWTGNRFEWIPSEEPRRVQSSAATSIHSIGSLVLEALRLEEREAGAPRRRSARPPALPKPPLAGSASRPSTDVAPDPRVASGRSGTHPKIASSPVAPGHRLRESVVPSRRPDPRAEPTGTDWMDDATTLKVRVSR
jgi:hypothetical protein